MNLASKRKVARSQCTKCIKIVQLLPIFFVLIIISWSYYAYVFEMCGSTIRSMPKKIIYLLFYHIFFIMFFLVLQSDNINASRNGAQPIQTFRQRVRAVTGFRKRGDATEYLGGLFDSFTDYKPYHKRCGQMVRDV